MVCLMCSAGLAADPAAVGSGHPGQDRLAGILAAAGQLEKPGERIVALSGQFIGAPYAANTLIGGPQQAEQLVINLAGFDCFTLLDVVEALRRSPGPDDFPAQLVQVRYRDGRISYADRRHFFSDWPDADDAIIADVTREVGQGRARVTTKTLNRRDDGSLWLPGLAVIPRDIVHIPADAIDETVLAALQAGDYVGIYSELAGLDVSHTGLIVRADGKVLLRHASSRGDVERVVDEELSAYLQGKPGLVVYRVRP